MAKLCRLSKDSRDTVINANISDTTNTQSQVLSHHIQQNCLQELKALNWKEWAFTDGSCVTNKENGYRSIGAGVYHPQSNKITTVNPEGTSINKTINRAKLAGIAAALINEHTHIATDSAGK